MNILLEEFLKELSACLPKILLKVFSNKLLKQFVHSVWEIFEIVPEKLLEEFRKKILNKWKTNSEYTSWQIPERTLGVFVKNTHEGIPGESLGEIPK